MDEKTTKNIDIVEVAEKQRHMVLLRKINSNKGLTKQEITELARFEKKNQKKEAVKSGKNNDLGLNERQEMFCKEYLIDLNGKQAAIRAGYTAKSAEVTASKMLRNPKVQKLIEQLKSQREKRTEITADRVLVELGRLAFSNITDFVNQDKSGLSLKKLCELTPEQVACLAELTEFETDRGLKRIRFKLHDKVKALELIGRHLSMFEENVNHRFPDDCGVLMVPQGMDKEAWSQLAKKNQKSK